MNGSINIDLYEKFFHITWVTHNSRTSQRMIEYKVKKGEPTILSKEEEVEITSYITQISKEINLKVLAYNICKDHVHILLNCEETKLANIIRILKGKSTQLFKKKHDITQDFHLWARKYNCSYIETEEKFYSCIEYIKNNRKKHSLTENELLNTIITKMVDYRHSYEQWVATHCSITDSTNNNRTDDETRIVNGNV